MTPPSERAAGTATQRRDPDIERLLQGRLHEPRRVLGVHAVGDVEAVVRVLKPSAVRVSLVEPAVELTRVPGTALFEWRGPRGSVTAPYRIRHESHDGRWHEEYDPYSFAPEIDDDDLARFAAGTHIAWAWRAARCFSAPRRIRSSSGRFLPRRRASSCRRPARW
jgi:1,4-alpha-glucan branching enzyme